MTGLACFCTQICSTNRPTKRAPLQAAYSLKLTKVADPEGVAVAVLAAADEANSVLPGAWMGVLLADTLLRELSVTVRLLADVEVPLGGIGTPDSVRTTTLLVEAIGAGDIFVSVGRATLLVGAMDAAGAVDVDETPRVEAVPAKFIVEAAFASGLAVGGKP